MPSEWPPVAPKKKAPTVPLRAAPPPVAAPHVVALLPPRRLSLNVPDVMSLMSRLWERYASSASSSRLDSSRVPYWVRSQSKITTCFFWPGAKGSE